MRGNATGYLCPSLSPVFTCSVFLGKLFIFCTFFVYKTLRIEFTSFVKLSEIL